MTDYRRLAACLLVAGCTTAQPPGERVASPAVVGQVASAPVPPRMPAPTATSNARSKVESEAPAIIADENNIFFAPGASAVDAEGKEKLQLKAEVLRQNRKALLYLAGYADDTGSHNYNLAIIEQRLSNIRALLHGMGVPARQIRRRSPHIEKMPATCTSAACRQKTQRVQLIVK
ncbi:MAG: OmpA family protein [Azonexus sp.]